MLLGRGVHPRIVSEMLGHSTIAITFVARHQRARRAVRPRTFWPQRPLRRVGAGVLVQDLLRPGRRSSTGPQRSRLGGRWDLLGCL
ncbi:MAG TPA: hypothetical protein VGS17_01330 [Candidatus Limnocylindria bacterium]|nr:hypothetical protein [Candidatus Limnocylindria bacterium]